MKQHLILLFSLILFEVISESFGKPLKKKPGRVTKYSRSRKVGRTLITEVAEEKCPINSTFSWPHAVHGFWLRSGILDGEKKKCIQPDGEGAIKEAGDCVINETQLWDLQPSESEPPSKFWFQIKTNNTEPQKCLTVDGDSMKLEDCSGDKKTEQFWAFLPRKDKEVPGHQLLVSMERCECLEMQKDGRLFFSPCSSELNYRNPFWVLESTKKGNCKSKQPAYEKPEEGAATADGVKTPAAEGETEAQPAEPEEEGGDEKPAEAEAENEVSGGSESDAAPTEEKEVPAEEPEPSQKEEE